ncbi:MAG: hypothetical protein AAF957_26160, partial [Planctomycetota bacterium]
MLVPNQGDGTFDELLVDLERGNFDRDGDIDLVATTGGLEGLVWFPNVALGTIGDDVCASFPNSTGAVATTTAFGSDRVALNRVQLRSVDLPANAAGYYLASLTPDVVVAVMAGQTWRFQAWYRGSVGGAGGGNINQRRAVRIPGCGGP